MCSPKHIGLKRAIILLGLTLVVPTASVQAQLDIKPGESPQCLFPGAARNVRIVLHNPGSNEAFVNLQVQLLQTSSTTAAPANKPRDWKKLQVLPGQTILESVPVSVPDVRGETSFLLRFIEGTNKVLGTMEILVYPTNLLQELKPLAGDKPPGLYDPQNILKPLLKALDLEFIDLDETGLENFTGRLVILGPFASKDQVPPGLAKQIKTVARKGVAAIWLLPPPEPGAKLTPSFHLVPEGSGVVLVAQAALVDNLSENPRAQLNLVELARIALHSEPVSLPELTP